MTKKEKNVDSLPYKKAGVWYRIVKRTFDIIMSLFGILVLSPVLLILLILDAIASHGHPIFKDHRVGKDSKPIDVYKFRTMYADAETNIDKYLTEEQKKEWFEQRKVENDPRVTPIGKLLRKTSTDELPQLFNILFGTMTFIGPRPITRKELDDHFTEEEQKILLSCRPGLIGYWGVMGRSDIGFESGRQKLELDYFKLRGIWFDFTLFFRVIPAVLKGKGAK